MKQVSHTSSLVPSRKSLIGMAVASALFAAHAPGYAAGVVSVKGVVAGSYFTAPTSTAVGTSAASYYGGGKACFDLNGNGVCDAGEPTATVSASGSFVLVSTKAAGLVVDIPTTATNAGHAVTQHIVLRAPMNLITENTIAPTIPANVAVTPMSTEVVRLMLAEGSAYTAAKDSIAERLGVAEDEVLADPNKLTDAADRQILANEATLLTNRFGLATRMFDRQDAVAGTVTAAEEAAMNVEGIPRYDHIFIVMLENKATSSVINSPYAPNINQYLQTNNQFTNYFATGNPSEPNYTALGAADDFGIGDDDQWNCFATGTNAPQDLPLPTNNQPGLASSPFSGLTTPAQITSACGSSNVNHNIVGRPNLFNAISGAGMTWRTYNESTNPGQDMRTDSVADKGVVATDHVYLPGTLNSNTTTIGSPTLSLPLPAGLYKTKHNPAMAYQGARSAPEFVSSNRTMGGGQWDGVYTNATAYAIPQGFNVDQFGSDLLSGDVGNLNYVIPDQCDDMHSITVSGTDSATNTAGTASDCSGVSGGNDPAPNDSHNNIMARSDNYVKRLVTQIQGSPIWQNPSQRVAIVLMFDEGSATDGVTNSCCGWNPGNSKVAKPLIQNPDGSFSVDSSVVNYSNGNRGHGNSIFAVLNNQPSAPKGIKDSDAYSHFSFVRTLQDMFGLSDPAVAGSYMNRSKYTESFIAANLLSLPEYAGSADTHFDSVRPMNHAYVIPSTYSERQSTDESIIRAGSGNALGSVPAQVGPDANQINVWALK